LSRTGRRRARVWKGGKNRSNTCTAGWVGGSGFSPPRERHGRIGGRGLSQRGTWEFGKRTFPVEKPQGSGFSQRANWAGWDPRGKNKKKGPGGGTNPFGTVCLQFQSNAKGGKKKGPGPQRGGGGKFSHGPEGALQGGGGTGRWASIWGPCGGPKPTFFSWFGPRRGKTGKNCPIFGDHKRFGGGGGPPPRSGKTKQRGGEG